MERLLSAVVENPTATVAGLIGMVCLAAWPLFRARSTMLGTYIGNNLGFVAHYALLGQWTAVAMNGLMVVQTVVAIWLVRWPGLRWAYFALMPALAGVSLVTWQGLPSLLAAAATTLSTIGRMQRNDIVLRVLLLSSTPFWTAHDLVIGSLPGLVADVLSMATGATMLLRSPAFRTWVISARQRLARRLIGESPFGQQF
jgi:Bacterial inner membrane protein